MPTLPDAHLKPAYTRAWTEMAMNAHNEVTTTNGAANNQLSSRGW